jgi:hypothetical protein
VLIFGFHGNGKFKLCSFSDSRMEMQRGMQVLCYPSLKKTVWKLKESHDASWKKAPLPNLLVLGADQPSYAAPMCFGKNLLVLAWCPVAVH